ncbi:MAG: efflux RND transporter periplasmic adaptor subunit, partial [Myxococcota bacterium]
FRPPPESVEMTQARQDSWTSQLRAVGTVTAVKQVTISTEIPGIVSAILFKSGDEVKAGQTLLRLNTSVERAQLEAAKASASLAEINLERSNQLRERKFTSEAANQAELASAKQSKAQVAQALASIDRRTIRAPFSGRIGIREVNLGQYLNPGSPVAELVSLSPVYVDFSLPQRHLGVLKAELAVAVRADAFGDERFEGVIESVDATVDPSSRNVRVRAVLKNEALKLRSGMFVEVLIDLGDAHEVVLAPATAVVYAPYGNSIFVVEDKDGQRVATQRFIRVGERRGDFVSVESGLSAGEVVVSAGAFKLRNGSEVVEGRATLEPKISPDPTDT